MFIGKVESRFRGEVVRTIEYYFFRELMVCLFIRYSFFWGYLVVGILDVRELVRFYFLILLRFCRGLGIVL